MFPLLGYASLMIGGDSVMDTVDRLNLWRILDAIWLPILLCASYHTGAYFPYQRGPPAVFQAVGLRLLVIVEAFGMLYWSIFPFGPFFQS